MLEPPNLSNDDIAACLREAYGIDATQTTFLPLGVDQNSAVYRVVSREGKAYFVKLRRGAQSMSTIALLKPLSDLGLRLVIPPLATTYGELWAALDPFALTVYPFVQGQNGYEVALNDAHWCALGAALRCLHTAALPQALLSHITRETYTPHWRQSLRALLMRLDREIWREPVAAEAAAFLAPRREQTLEWVRRAESLAEDLQQRPRPFVLCHADIHAGNVLIDSEGHLFIVDWDEVVLAPKERDLMYVGGAQGFIGHTAEEQERLFYQGYGAVQVDLAVLAYYRYERMVQDLALFGEQILGTQEGGTDRAQSLRYLKSNYTADGPIAAADSAWRCLRSGSR